MTHSDTEWAYLAGVWTRRVTSVIRRTKRTHGQTPPFTSVWTLRVLPTIHSSGLTELWLNFRRASHECWRASSCLSHLLARPERLHVF